MTIESKIKKIMQDNGFVLVRRSKHLIWKDAQGTMVVTSVTPSDRRSLRNVEATVKRAREKRAGK